MKLTHALVAAVPAVLLAQTAHAVRQPTGVAERPLEVKEGQLARVAKRTTYVAPRASRTAWNTFRAERGQWKALWDADTGVPTRIYGQGIPATGAVADAAIAESIARDLLAERIALLAPGAKASDFVLLQNELRAGVRQVRFTQTWRGLQVIGAGVSFTFKLDRLVAMGSTAAPDLFAAEPAAIVSRADAASSARAWIDGVYGAGATVVGTGQESGAGGQSYGIVGTADAVVLPIARSSGKRGVEYRVVVPVVVSQASPRGEWTVYVDAASGEPVARKQSLLFAQGVVKFHVPIRYPAGGYEDVPAPFTTHTVDGDEATSDASGIVTWATETSASVLPGLVGTLVRVQNGAGSIASTTLTLPVDGDVIWDESDEELKNAQLTGFIRINEAKEYARKMDPQLAMLSSRMTVNVNVEGECNAFYNPQGRSVNFFPSGASQGITCGNTGELADVMRHEFGHALHHAAFGNGGFDGSLSEGAGDYFAATMANDPAMGLGFFTGTADSPLRHIDPEGSERVWPDDISDFDPHETGLIIAGALWDLRKALIADLGEADGVALADDIFYGIIARADDIPSSYTEALIVDDDDGDLSNGTPNDCTIAQAFGAHGLGDGAAAILPPVVEDLTITLAQVEVDPTCPAPLISSANVSWHVRGQPSVGGQLALDAAGDVFTATLPDDARDQVVQYQVTATLEDGSTRAFPQNAADPWYELYAGAVTVLYCTDFETDPTADGWTLGNGFSWGAPTGGGSDPDGAYSGASVIGVNLGGNYDAEASYTATSPEIDTAGFDVVRLQYRRWLGVEDSTYDQATISADGQQVWVNLAEEGFTQHIDREWRFHDVDITEQAADGTVQIELALSSDGGVEYGGWTVDDFCVVAAAVDCEEVDENGHCLDDHPPGGGDGGCCSTSGDGGAGPVFIGLGLAAMLLRRRRRS